MPLFGGLRAHSKYDEGTKLLNRLESIEDPTTRRDTLKRAIESLTAATELKPDFGPAWHNLGHAYYYSGRLLVEAANALEESNESNDSSPDSRVEFFRNSAVATYENSLKVLDVAVKLMPDAAEVHNSRGRTLVVLHRDEEASNEFKIASEIDPSNRAAMDNQNTLEVFTKAEESFGQLSNVIESLRKQGDASYNAGEYADAISKFHEIIRLSPDDVRAYFYRGIAYRRHGQHCEATNDFTKTIELNPNYAAAYYNRGLSYFGLNLYQLAIDDYGKAIELHPNAGAFYNRGRSYDALGQYEQAIEDFEKTIELDSDNGHAYQRRGISYMELSKHEQAIEDFDKAIELNPSNSINYNRGLSYFNLSRYQQAIDDFDKAIEGTPDDAEAYYFRGRSYQALGQYERAIGDYDEAVSLNPNYAWAYYNRGLSHHGLGQYERAIEDYDNATKLGGSDFAEALTNKQMALRALTE